MELNIKIKHMQDKIKEIISSKNIEAFDNDGHRYQIPKNKQKEWNEWLEIPEDDERCWDIPEFAERIDGEDIQDININAIIQVFIDMVEEVEEELADIEHRRWSKWQKHMHSKFVEHSDDRGEYVCLPIEFFRRWERQIATPYLELSEEEKESDRKEARVTIQALLTKLKQ